MKVGRERGARREADPLLDFAPMSLSAPASRAATPGQLTVAPSPSATRVSL